MAFTAAFSPSSFFRLCRAAAVGGILTCTGSSAQAALILYEGFNYTTGALSTKTPNASTIGLNTSVAYQGATVGNYTVTGSSLTFSTNFATSGGSISIGSGTGVGAAQMSLASSYTGTLYSSYLVRLASRSTAAAGDGALSRISNDTANTGEHFLNMADSRSSSTQVAIGYDATTVTAGTSLSLNTTYLMLARFTRVGQATNVTSGVATVYALTSAQYDSFIAAGGTEAYLDSAVIGTGGSQISARGSDSYSSSTALTFATGQYAQFVSVNDSTTFDELRYGSTLADVTPIPEPSSAVLLLAGVAAVGFRRRSA